MARVCVCMCVCAYVCAQVTRWPIGPTGLLYDREWALLDDQGRVVTQKLCPAAARIVPHIDLERGTPHDPGILCHCVCS